jgi:hypothetical protein
MQSLQEISTVSSRKIKENTTHSSQKLMLGEDLALAASKTTKNQIFKVETLMTYMLSTYMALLIVI